MSPLRLRDLSIRRKLTLIIVLSAGLALTVAAAALLTYEWVVSRRALQQRIEALAQIVGYNSAVALSFGNPADAEDVLAGLGLEPHITEAVLYAPDGSPFAQYQNDHAGFTAPPVQPDGSRFGSQYLTVFRSIMVAGDRVGTVYVKADVGELYGRLRHYAGFVFLFVLLPALLVLAAASRLREVVSGPILELAQTMRRVTEESNYALRATKRGQDEVGTLIDGFNGMLGQMQERDSALLRARDELEHRAQELQVELAERHHAEALITASLHEKEVLLREIHHRVKNNLQVISSLLDLQASRVEDEAVAAMFRDSQNRVSTMGLIHERLYQARDLSRIAFSEYVRDLVTNLFYSYSVDPSIVSLDLSTEEMVVDLDRAIPCGLIINELVSNALKHAFPSGRSGRITVEVRREGSQVVMSVADDGAGLPKGIDLERTPSLGLRLVHTLVRQLRGTVALECRNGTRFTIGFKA